MIEGGYIIVKALKPGELFIGTKENKPEEHTQFSPKITINYSEQFGIPLPCEYIFYKNNINSYIDEIEFRVPPLMNVFASGLDEYLNAITVSALVNNFNQADFEGRRVAISPSNNNNHPALKPAALKPAALKPPQAQPLKPAALKPAVAQAQPLKPAALKPPQAQPLKPAAPNANFLNELNNRLAKKQ